MNRSQLRKLARDYAFGKIEDDEYRARRRRLVDDIVSGNLAIVREPPPMPPEPASPDDPTSDITLVNEPKRSWGAPVFIGFSAAVVVAVALWALLPLQTDSGDPRMYDGGEAASATASSSRARMLVEDFVAVKDFSEFSIASFKESWSHLTRAEKWEAKQTAWFDDLTHLINEEIKAQNALAASGDQTAALEVGRRLMDFAAFLGVSGQVADFQGAVPAPTAVSSTTSPAPRDAEAEPASSASEGGTMTTATASSANASATGAASGETPPAARRTFETVAMSEWLSGLPDDGYTLQLFAVNQLDQVRALMSEHPNAGVRVLVSDGNDPLYRVVYGTFDSAADARSAYNTLPAGFRQAQPEPVVRRLRDLRAALTGGNPATGSHAN